MAITVRHYAGVFPVNSRGEVLIQLRDDRDGLRDRGRWTTLGGAVEPGETPEAAARRELMEECGMSPAALLPAGTSEFRAIEGDRVVHTHYYACAVDWSPEELILGEGQAMAWLAPALIEMLPLSVVGPEILAFVRSTRVEELAAVAAPMRDVAAPSLPDGFAAALGIQPGDLVHLLGATVGFAARLRAALPAGARVTASPADWERPDLVLAWPARSHQR
jgi:8-oxo-dGTP pyrophosphatase MutT (NUDIX family)